MIKHFLRSSGKLHADAPGPRAPRGTTSTGVALLALASWASVLSAGCFAGAAPAPAPFEPARSGEVRGTWVTTTANDAIANPANTGATMKRLREIGLNTVYVETWKNGYTQFPSAALKAAIGVDRRPALVKQDPSDPDKAIESRDLLEETLIEAHRNGLVYIAWFEYGFMAAHKDTNNHLRRMYPQWLSRDAKGSEVAKNGFVWMNPLHPGPRKLLLDIVLESARKYDLDGVQLDDRIVWPYYDMGYDDFTKQAYAKDHAGQQPPADPKDPTWTRWRADKVNEYSKIFTQGIRTKAPGVLISLSPAVYPWCYENYLLEWPKWSAWTASDKLTFGGAGNAVPGWDEFIPQNYRFSFDAFEKTWLDQVKHMRELGANRQRALIAGIRLVGEGKDSTWEQLSKSMDLARQQGGGGHVHWFSRGVLDVFAKDLTDYYAKLGTAPNPHFPADWRKPSVKLAINDDPKQQAAAGAGNQRWTTTALTPGTYRVIAHDGTRWSYFIDRVELDAAMLNGGFSVDAPTKFKQVEVLVDRRADRARLPAFSPGK